MGLQKSVMPRRLLYALKSSAAAAPKPAVAKKKRRAGIVRQTVRTSVLAAALAISAPDDDEISAKWRLFDPGLLDRLTMPITRYHE